MAAAASRSNVTALSTKQTGKQPAIQTPQQQLQRSMFTLLKGAGYDVEDVYAHSTDDKGHYEEVRTKFPPTTEAIIEQIIEGDPRYRSKQDFIRDAVSHRAHFWATNTTPEVMELVVFDMMTSDSNRMKYRAEAWDVLINSVRQTGEVYLKAGALIELGDFLGRYDQEDVMASLPIGKRKEMQELLDDLHDKLKRTRMRDYE